MVWALIQFSRRLNWPFLQLLTDIQFSKISRSVSCPTLCDPRLLCPSLSPRICSISCPLNQWCHPAFSSCPQSFSASGSFPMSQLFVSDGWSIGASASASVRPMHIQGWFPVGLTGWISLLSKGFSRIFFSTTIQKHQFFGIEPLWSSSHIHTGLLEKP